jgi:hypothetical protein
MRHERAVFVKTVWEVVFENLELGAVAGDGLIRVNDAFHKRTRLALRNGAPF